MAEDQNPGLHIDEARLPPDAVRTSNKPITRRERERKLYALTGFVRVVKLQADCDFDVQVAQSRAVNAPQEPINLSEGPPIPFPTGRTQPAPPESPE